MELFRETKIDFMKQKWLWIGVSSLLIVHAFVQLAVNGIAKGVEFTGGAQVILKYPQPVDVVAVRRTLEGSGLKLANATTFGDDPSEISIRVALGDEQAQAGEADLAQQVVAALRPAEFKQKIQSGAIDLNEVDQVALAERFVQDLGLDRAGANAAAQAVSDWRKNNGGLFNSIEQAQAVPGLSDSVKGWLTSKAFTGPFALRSQDVILGSVSAEMRTKALWAMVGAMAGILIYVWVRFHFLWGLAAIMALLHDVIVTLGLFILFGYEADLPVVAAFLTLVGFSVNDTIVTFDRMRENLRSHGGKLGDLVNLSVNQMLSRTLITSFTVFMTALCLFLFGGPVLNPFAFVMTFGIVVGSYSSIYIAAPILVVWKDWLDERAERKQVPTKARA